MNWWCFTKKEKKWWMRNKRTITQCNNKVRCIHPRYLPPLQRCIFTRVDESEWPHAVGSWLGSVPPTVVVALMVIRCWCCYCVIVTRVFEQHLLFGGGRRQHQTGWLDRCCESRMESTDDVNVCGCSPVIKRIEWVSQSVFSWVQESRCGARVEPAKV